MSSSSVSATDSSVVQSNCYAKKTKKKKPSILLHAGAGGVAVIAAAQVHELVNKVPVSKMVSSALNNSAAFNDEFKRAAELAFNDSGLVSKGVKYVNAANLTSEQITNLSKTGYPKWIEKLPNSIKEKIAFRAKDLIRDCVYGDNACFKPRTNQILVNTENMYVAAFHEMGHAMNKFSKFGNILQKCRTMRALAVPILAIAAFKPQKAEGQRSSGVIDSTTTFIKNNAGKLAFAAFLPTLIEEGMASFKGAKLAKPHLSSDAFKQLKNAYGKAFLTYLGTAVAMSLMATAASWIHDMIAPNKKS